MTSFHSVLSVQTLASSYFFIYKIISHTITSGLRAVYNNIKTLKTLKSLKIDDTVVPHLAIAPLSDEITLRWTFGHCWSDRLVMAPMAKIRFATSAC